VTETPNTQTPPKVATAVVQRISPDQRQALERGEAVSLVTKRERIEVVDFYPQKAPA
jgi:hypothetical protein